ncbi:MAG: hypothetical protein KDG44_15385, partial [Burkholderiaceae bacterium]|nr:hypothetical protein [Burkholderiaceae bacterium]
MTKPSTAREALIVEAIGDVAKLLVRVEAMATAMQEAGGAFQQARLDLSEQVADFERRMKAMTEFAKTEVVKHLAARTEDATRRSIDQQTRAMADAARLAFGVEVGAVMQRLQATLQPLLEGRRRRGGSWLTHAAA